MKRSDAAFYIAPLLLTLGFPLSVLVLVSEAALKLALQDLGFTPFLVICLPLSVMCFARAFDLRSFSGLSRQERVPWKVSLVLVEAAIITVSLADARRGPFIPYGVSEAKREVQAVANLREQVTRDADFGGAAERLADKFSKIDSADGFKTLSDYWSGTNFIARYALFLNIAVVSYGLSFLAYLGYKVLHPDRPGPTSKARLSELIVAYSALALWFPLRVYSEWHNSFYTLDLDQLARFQALLPIFAALLVSLLLLVAHARPGSLVTWVKTVNGAGALLIGVVFAWKPQSMHFLTKFLAYAEWPTWALTGTILILGLFLVGKAIRKLG